MLLIHPSTLREETTMFAFEDVRFGFEVTMYINNR
jgi:coenzyme PQQ biosynthesis protein A